MRKTSSCEARGSFFLLIAFFLLLLHITVPGTILTSLPPSAYASPDPVISIDPDVISANPDQYFTINVNITYVEDLYSWAFKLKWPIDLLKAGIPVEDTTFFDGDFTYKVYMGYMGVGSALLGQVPGVTGSGTLASIPFQVTGTGNCTLELYDVELYNHTLGLIDHTVSDGYFYTTHPVAEFSFLPDPRVGKEYEGRPIAGETVTFDGTESYDPDDLFDSTPGGVVGYQWDFGDGATGTGMVAEHEFTIADVYEVTLTITDDDGETDEEIFPPEGLRIFLHDLAIVNVTVLNEPPKVMPGQTVRVNATVRNEGSDTEKLNVTAYLGPYPVNTMIFHYVVINPPPSPPTDYYSLESGEEATTTISCNTTGIPGGTYTVSVTAFLIHQVSGIWVRYDYPVEEDLDDNTFTDNEATIIFHDIAVTNVTANPTQVTVGDPVHISVTVTNEGTEEESFDVTTYYDGIEIETKPVTDLASEANKTLEFEWDTTLIPKGTYTISANASVVENETHTADNTFEDSDVTVRLPGDPVADFTHSPPKPDVNEEVTFDASSSDPDGGTIISYEWDFGDETIEIYVGANLTHISNHTYTDGGPYTVTLNVTDSEGKWGAVSKSITVYAPPVVNFTYSPSKPVVDGLITFNASGSYDPDGGNVTYPSGIVSYEWDFDDENTGTGNVTTHTYTEFGEYNVTLTVIDDEDVTNSTWKLITVYAPPVADFTYSPSGPVVDAPVTFNASASYDPDGGTIVSYEWDFDDENTGTGNVTTHTYTETGTYTVTLSVTDNDGLIGTTTADVTVSTQSLAHDVAITNVTPSPTVVAPGQYVSVTVVVENQGGYAETFNVTAYYDTSTVGVKTSTLESKATESLTFTWNTAVVAEDTYTISAEADVVSGETDVEDNTYIGGTVTVVRQVGPGQTLAIEFSGEREYFEGDDVKIRLVALVKYADTMMPASNANVTIRIFDSDGELWGSGVMVEKLTGTGIYEWESIDTIAQLELQKGFYLIHVQARLGGLEASTISQFRITTAEKTSSIISIDVNPTSATTGSSITLSGAISPKRPRVTVTIQFRLSGGTWSELRTVKTSQTGYYSVSWVVTTAGTYEVKASWPGDTRTEGTESEVKTVTVQEGSSLHLEIPPYVTVAIAAIVGSIVGSIIGAAVLMRARKPKPL